MQTNDMFGNLCKQYFETRRAPKLQLELDDGTIEDDFPISYYVDSTGFRRLEKAFLGYAKGQVLDIGCGSGRVGLHLKEHGLETVCVDISPGMAFIARQRGLTVYEMDVSKELPAGMFDTVVMYGNGFGLLGSIEKTKDFLQRLKQITSEDAIMIAESQDPNRQTNPLVLAYQDRNIKLGRYVGQRIWKLIAGEQQTAQFGWVQFEPSMLKQVAEESGWKIIAGPEFEEELNWGAYFFVLGKK